MWNLGITPQWARRDGKLMQTAFMVLEKMKGSLAEYLEFRQVGRLGEGRRMAVRAGGRGKGGGAGGRGPEGRAKQQGNGLVGR